MADNNSEGIFSAGEKWDQTQVNSTCMFYS